MNKFAHVISVNLIAFLLIVFSQIVYGANCGDPSPSVKKGIDPVASIEPRELKANEKITVIEIFKLLEGEWQGEAHGIECIGKSGIEEQTNDYLAKVSVNLKKRDSIEIEFVLHSSRNRSNAQFKDRLFLDNQYLMYEGKLSGFKATVLYVKDNFITYLRKLRTGAKGNIPFEYVRTIAIYGKDSLMIEDLKYVNGTLKSMRVYELK